MTAGRSASRPVPARSGSGGFRLIRSITGRERLFAAGDPVEQAADAAGPLVGRRDQPVERVEVEAHRREARRLDRLRRPASPLPPPDSSASSAKGAVRTRFGRPRCPPLRPAPDGGRLGPDRQQALEAVEPPGAPPGPAGHLGGDLELDQGVQHPRRALDRAAQRLGQGGDAEQRRGGQQIDRRRQPAVRPGAGAMVDPEPGLAPLPLHRQQQVAAVRGLAQSRLPGIRCSHPGAQLDGVVQGGDLGAALGGGSAVAEPERQAVEVGGEPEQVDLGPWQRFRH